MVSYRIGFSECEHKRASNGQHVRKRLFNESFPACQALISRNFDGPGICRKSVQNRLFWGDANLIGQRLAGE
jgi:hypothetical protein